MIKNQVKYGTAQKLYHCLELHERGKMLCLKVAVVKYLLSIMTYIMTAITVGVSTDLGLTGCGQAPFLAHGSQEQLLSSWEQAAHWEGQPEPRGRPCPPPAPAHAHHYMGSRVPATSYSASPGAPFYIHASSLVRQAAKPF